MTPTRSPCLMPRSDINARIPPSPSLSARMTTATYLNDVVINKRPDDQRQHADRDSRRRAASPVERSLQCIERTRPEIAVDDTECAQREHAEAALWSSRLAVGNGCRSRHNPSYGTAGPSRSVVKVVPEFLWPEKINKSARTAVRSAVTMKLQSGGGVAFLARVRARNVCGRRVHRQPTDWRI